MNYEYQYDAHGNPAVIADHVRGVGYYRWMHYDGLDRLTDAGSASFTGDHWHRMKYDAVDNLKSWTIGGNKDFANYVYDASHRLTSIQNSAGAAIVNLSYDVQGNLNSKDGKFYTFDMGNRLRNTNEEWYRYDGHGRRVQNWRATEPGTLSMYTQSGALIYDQNERASGRKYSDYIYLGGSLIATRALNIDTGIRSVTYTHTDALGSPVAVTNESGQVVDRTAYQPWGRPIAKPGYDGIGYTGHVRDGATQLTYMQQRYYDETIGRFLSVDPVAATPGVGFNRYSYAANNPYRFVDPDGREACGKDTTCRISSGMSAGTINGTIAGANGSTFNSDGSVRTDRSATAAQRDAVGSMTYRQALTGSSAMENWIFMDDGGKVLGKTQQGCTGDDSCSLAVNLVPVGTTLAGHAHIYPAALGGSRLPEVVKLAREFPGKGDGRVLALGYVGAAFMPSGARYLIEGNPPRAVYMGGGDPAFGRHVSNSWRAGMTDAEILQAARDYLDSQR